MGRRGNQNVFDETKIKLSESKAWASSQAAKISQASALCLAHNPLLAYEHKLEGEESMANVAEKSGEISDWKSAVLQLRIKNAFLTLSKKPFSASPNAA
jgi:hypothetical protein